MSKCKNVKKYIMLKYKNAILIECRNDIIPKCHNGRMADSQIPTKWQVRQNDKTDKMDRKVYKERMTNIIVR